MKYSRIIFFLILATLAAVYARTAQLLYLTEPQTGFFTPDGKPAAVALSAFILLATVVSAVMSFFTRRHPAGAPDKALATRIGAAVLAVACIYEALFVRYVSNASVIILLTRISAVFAAAALAVYILRFYVPAINKLSKMLYLPILIFFALKLISTFTVYATVSVIADNVFHIAFMCCALVFALYFLKLENDISPGRSAYRLFPLGIATFITGACCTVPQVVLFALGRNELVHSDPSSLVFPAAAAVFVLCYTLSLYGKKNILRRKRNTPKLESNTSYHEMSGQFVSGRGKHRRKK